MKPDTLADRIAPYPAVLMEGAVIERLKRETGLDLDPLLLNTPLIYDDAGRTAMTRIYSRYITIAADYRLPILLAAPTWRANPERIGRRMNRDVAAVNRDAIDFMRGIANVAEIEEAPVIVGGLMACRGDAYKPQEALSAGDAEAFHAPQAQSLADAGADYIMAATLPALSEALGHGQGIGTTDDAVSDQLCAWQKRASAGWDRPGGSDRRHRWGDRKAAVLLHGQLRSPPDPEKGPG